MPLPPEPDALGSFTVKRGLAPSPEQGSASLAARNVPHGRNLVAVTHRVHGPADSEPSGVGISHHVPLRGSQRFPEARLEPTR